MSTKQVLALFASVAAVAAALGAVILPGAVAQGQVPVHGFQTPSKHINCTYYEYGEEPAVLGCEVRDYTGPSPTRPKDCEFDWNALPSIGIRGKASLFACVSDTRRSSVKAI